jgi:hypothetical protein
MNEEANRMDCAQFEEIVHDLDRRGTQGMALREIALVHAESCSGCAKLMTQTESLDFALQSLASRFGGASSEPIGAGRSGDSRPSLLLRQCLWRSAFLFARVPRPTRIPHRQLMPKRAFSRFELTSPRRRLRLRREKGNRRRPRRTLPSMRRPTFRCRTQATRIHSREEPSFAWSCLGPRLPR